MKNKILTTSCLAAALVVVSATQVATAGVTANAAATSNYVWRGLTQSGNASAVSGGLDYEAPMGFSVGTWVSDTAFGSQELDVYGGWGMKFGPVGFNVGAIAYIYPQYNAADDPATTDDERDVNWAEGSVGVSFSAGPVDLSGKVNFSPNVFGTEEKGVYIEFGAETAMPGFKDTTLAVHVGNYTFDVDATDASKATFNPAKETSSGYDDYTDVSVSISHDAWTFAISDTNLESDSKKGTDFSLDDRAKFTVTYAKEFTLLK